MNIPHKQLSVDINRKNQYTVDFIGHVNDKDVRYIDVTFNAGGTPITLEEGCTATVTYVSEGVLIDQAAVCVVTGSTVVIGVDSEKVENLRSGILEVQPKVVDPNGRILTIQIPILVRISPDIAEHGQVDDDSLGSYAEVVREIAAARGSYTNLKDRLDHSAAPSDEQVAEALEDYFDEHPTVESVLNKKSEISGQSQEGDDDTNYPTVGAVRNYADAKAAELEDYIDDSLDDLDAAKADAENVYTKAEVDGKLSSVYKYKGSVATYQDLPSNNLTAGDTYNVETDGANYAWTGSDWDKLGDTIDISGKVDKTQTIAGVALSGNISASTLKSKLGINSKANAADVYTKTEVNAAIAAAIGGVENGSY